MTVARRGTVAEVDFPSRSAGCSASARLLFPRRAAPRVVDSEPVAGSLVEERYAGVCLDLGSDCPFTGGPPILSGRYLSSRTVRAVIALRGHSKCALRGDGVRRSGSEARLCEWSTRW